MRLVRFDALQKDRFSFPFPPPLPLTLSLSRLRSIKSVYMSNYFRFMHSDKIVDRSRLNDEISFFAIFHVDGKSNQCINSRYNNTILIQTSNLSLLIII